VLCLSAHSCCIHLKFCLISKLSHQSISLFFFAFLRPTRSFRHSLLGTYQIELGEDNPPTTLYSHTSLGFSMEALIIM
jgi:hypothetical protein